MRVLLAGLLALASVSLVSCSDSTSSYCDDLKARASVFTSAASATDVSALSDVLTTIDELRRRSPEDLRDEWDTFYYAWEDLVDALASAGVTGAVPQQGKRPEGVAAADWKRVQDAAAQLRSSRVADAVSALEQQALDVCKVDLQG